MSLPIKKRKAKQPKRRKKTARYRDTPSFEEKQIKQVGGLLLEKLKEIQKLREYQARAKKRGYETGYPEKHKQFMKQVREYDIKIQKIKEIDIDYYVDSLETLRKRENVYRAVRDEEEQNPLRATETAEWLKKALRKYYGRGLKFEADGSLLTVRFTPHDDSGQGEKIIMQVAYDAGVYGHDTPYPEITGSGGAIAKMLKCDEDTGECSVTFETCYLDTEKKVEIDEDLLWEW